MPDPPDRAAVADVADLVGRARAGSRDALGRLLDACREYLLLIANEELDADLRGKAGPSDLVQETFLEAQRDFARFRGGTEAELLAWLRRILLNNVANFRRRYQGTERRRVEREVPLEVLDRLGRGLARAAESPSGHAVRREEAEALDRALARLPDHYRQVIVLRHREQRPFEEIGRLMGRSPDAARMLWWRAFERLADELTPPDEHDPPPPG